MPGVPKKNTAFTWVFFMGDATSPHIPETGLTVTVQISKDGAAFAALTGAPAVSEISAGFYEVTIAAADMDADVVALKATATGAAQTNRTIELDDRIISDLPSNKTGYSLSVAGTDAVGNQVWEEQGSQHQTVGSFGHLLQGGGGVDDGKVVTDAGNSTTQVKTDLAEITDDHYNDQVIVFITGVEAGQSRRISDYDGTNKIITMEQALSGIPAVDDQFVISAQMGFDPLARQVPGSYTSGQAGAVLGLFGSGLATTSVPVATTEAITIIRGDDQKDADGRSLEFSTTDAATWPDLTGASITFTATKGTSTITKAGTVVTPTGANKKVRVELDSADTASSPTGTYDYDVQATLASGNKITLVLNTLTLRADVTT